MGCRSDTGHIGMVVNQKNNKKPLFFRWFFHCFLANQCSYINLSHLKYLVLHTWVRCIPLKKSMELRRLGHPFLYCGWGKKSCLLLAQCQFRYLPRSTCYMRCGAKKRGGKLGHYTVAERPSQATLQQMSVERISGFSGAFVVSPAQSTWKGPNMLSAEIKFPYILTHSHFEHKTRSKKVLFRDFILFIGNSNQN